MRFLLSVILTALVTGPAHGNDAWQKDLEAVERRIIAQARESAKAAAVKNSDADLPALTPGVAEVTRRSIAERFGTQVPDSLRVHPDVHEILPSGEPLDYCRLAFVRGKTNDSFEKWSVPGMLLATRMVTYFSSIDILVMVPGKPLVGVVRLLAKGSASTEDPLMLFVADDAKRHFRVAEARRDEALRAMPACPD